MAKVLVVDDSLFMRNNLKNILLAAGFSVVGEACDGVEAVEMYERLRPDIMTLDITMPRMSGLEALKQIKQIDQNAIVIMCSSMGQDYFITDALKSGAKDFLIKPFKPMLVVETIKKSLPKN